MESEDKIEDSMALIILVDPGQCIRKTCPPYFLTQENIKISPIINSKRFELHRLLAGQYRTIDDLVRNETQGAGSMELLSLKEIRDDETKIE